MINKFCKTDITVIRAIAFICFTVHSAIALKEKAEEEYVDFYLQCENWEYTCEAHKIITEDQWELTLFRITGTIEQ